MCSGPVLSIAVKVVVAVRSDLIAMLAIVRAGYLVLDLDDQRSPKDSRLMVMKACCDHPRMLETGTVEAIDWHAIDVEGDGVVVVVVVVVAVVAWMCNWRIDLTPNDGEFLVEAGGCGWDTWHTVAGSLDIHLGPDTPLCRRQPFTPKVMSRREKRCCE